jgi:uncharacterized BrkB/YihY/UPF0761 family membrane protein
MERFDRLRSTVTDTVERATAATDTARKRWVAVDTAFAIHDRDRRRVGGALAGAVAFRLFVYLLPLALATLSLLGVVANLGGDAGKTAGDELDLSGYLIDSVETATAQSQRGLWLLIPLALWATYTAGSGAAKVLRAAHSLAWDQPMTRLRPAWAGAAASFVLVLLALGVVAVTQALRAHSEVAGLVFGIAQVLILIGMWWVASRYLPHDPAAGWWALLPGAVLVGVGLDLLHMASAFFLARRVASASELYGSLGVAAAILAWLYLLGRLLVGSAMLNATLWERHRADQPPLGSGGAADPSGSPDASGPVDPADLPDLPNPADPLG